MNTKEAIEWIEDLVNDYSEVEGNESIVDDFRKIIFLLQQGEKYRLMWKEIEKFYKDAVLPLYTETFENIVNNVPLVGYKFYYYKTLETILNDVEQKYFPKQKAQGSNPIKDFMEFSKYIDMKRQREKKSNQDYKEGEE